jgi:hypothetical protein
LPAAEKVPRPNEYREARHRRQDVEQRAVRRVVAAAVQAQVDDHAPDLVRGARAPPGERLRRRERAVVADVQHAVGPPHPDVAPALREVER